MNVESNMSMIWVNFDLVCSYPPKFIVCPVCCWRRLSRIYVEHTIIPKTLTCLHTTQYVHIICKCECEDAQRGSEV